MTTGCPDAAREIGEAEIGIGQHRTDQRVLNPALPPARHTLHMHDFLMIGAVVVDDVEHRNGVMRRRPQRARHIHEVAVIL